QSIRNSVSKWAKRKNIKETPKFKTFSFNKENNAVPVEAVDSITKVLVEYLFTSSTYIKGTDQYLGLYLNFHELPDAEIKLSKIQIFKCGAGSFGLVSYASRISRDIRQLDIRLKVKENSRLEDKYTHLKDVAKLIQSQRNLRQILIQYNPEFYYQDEIIDLWNNLMI